MCSQYLLALAIPNELPQVPAILGLIIRSKSIHNTVEVKIVQKAHVVSRTDSA